MTTPAESSPTSEETPSTTDKLQEKGLLERWIREVNTYERETKNWRNKASKIIKKTKNQQGNNTGGIRYNIRWSTWNTLKPVIYAKTPKPVAERRFKDSDPAARLACELLQRSTTFLLHDQDFDGAMRDCRDDYLLPGRGTSWVRYDPTFTKNDAGDEAVEHEAAVTDYIFWQDFGHNICRRWQEVYCVWKKVYLTKKEVTEKFNKDIADKLTYTAEKGLDEDVRSDEGRAYFKKAEIIELWNKEDKKVYKFCKNYKEGFLSVEDDPLHLKGFFPCPKPLFATLSTDSIIPVPDDVFTEDIADDLDSVCQRTADLLDACRASGICDNSAADQIKELFSADENDIIPVKNFLMLKQQGGASGLMEFLPLDKYASVLQKLYEGKAALEQQYYQVTGISDIVRGSSNPYETEGAQQIKAQFATQRISERQQAMQKFCAENIALMAEIVAEHFGDDTIYQMASVDQMPADAQELFPDAVALLRNDLLRNFRITIETDSTISTDDGAEKAAMNEYITAVGQMVSQIAPVLQAIPQMKPVALEIIKKGARNYRAGRQIEAMLEDAVSQHLDEIRQQQENPPPQQPDPAMLAVQVDQMKAQAKAQIDQAKLEAKTQVDQMKAQFDAQLKQSIAQTNADVATFKAQQDIALKQKELEYQTQLKAKEIELKTSQAATASQPQGDPATQALLQQVLMLLQMKGEIQGTGQPILPGSDLAAAIPDPPIMTGMKSILEGLQAQSQAIMALAEQISKPRVAEFKDGPDGKRIAVSRTLN